MIQIEEKDSSEAVFKGLEFLKNNQNSNGSICFPNSLI